MQNLTGLVNETAFLILLQSPGTASWLFFAADTVEMLWPLGAD